MYGRHGANRGDRHKTYYRCSTYALAVIRQETHTCLCGNNQVPGAEVEAVVLDHLRRLKVDLSRAEDRVAILRLYAVKGQKEDVLAQTIRQGAVYYAETIRNVFRLDKNPTSKLARLVARLESPEEATEVLRQTAIGFFDGDDPRTGEPACPHALARGKGGQAVEVLTDELRDIIQEIEATKGLHARQLLDQLQGEYDTLTRAKALAKSDRERESLDRQLREMEQRQDDLEDHLTPLPQKRDEMVKEIRQLHARIAEAERVFADGDSLAKSEALRRALGERGRSVLHFQHYTRTTPDKRSKSGRRRRRCVWLKDQTEFRHSVQAEEGTDMQHEQALALLREYVTDPSIGRHCLAVEAAMRAYARKLGQDEEKWGVVGLLHDFDYERWPDPPDHPLKGSEILRQHGYPEDVIYAIKSHADYLPDCPRVHLMDKALYACDELCGFISACALVRPNGITDLTAASVKKKMKSKGFARNVKREDIERGAAEFGVDLTEHIQFVIDALKPHAAELGLLHGAGGDEG